ncbi:MAG TPA: alanine racemase, partial [Phenylobacterium sp.]|nr:alanine racemase [Phenylobacterium sp.]
MTDQDLHAHLIGRQGSRADLNTPVLVIDAPALKRNIAEMARFAASKGLQVRPHAKTHKSADIAKLQIAAGAVGLCCAKLGEAEALAEGGVLKGLHITSPVVSPPAIARLAALNLKVEAMMCVVDHPDNAAALGEACAKAGKPLNVVIDIDPGIRRTGVASAEAAVALLAAIRAQPGLTYKGVQFYCGAQQHLEDFAARKAAMEDRAAYLRTVIAALTQAGGAPEIVTGSGTGTHRIDADFGLFTELQVGSYLFMDAQYLACGEIGPYETSLYIDARVVSANAAQHTGVSPSAPVRSWYSRVAMVSAARGEGIGPPRHRKRHGEKLLRHGQHQETEKQGEVIEDAREGVDRAGQRLVGNEADRGRRDQDRQRVDAGAEAA